MTVLLMGENSYEIHHHLRQLEDQFEGAIEKFDGTELELRQLPDILTGTSLFSQQRLVIIRNLSFNKSLWDRLPEWLDRISDDVQLVLVEVKPDKRTKTYKLLQKNIKIIEYSLWTERNQDQAKKWVASEAKRQKIELSPSLVQLLVSQVGVDQWQLRAAIDKISVYDKVTENLIRSIIDVRSSESIFELFETALKGDRKRLSELLQTFVASEDPYLLFGLLSGQAFQLASLTVSRRDDNVAKDIGFHPYALSRLRQYANKLGPEGGATIIELFAEADDAIKTASINPWLAIEQVLFRVAVT